MHPEVLMRAVKPEPSAGVGSLPASLLPAAARAGLLAGVPPSASLAGPGLSASATMASLQQASQGLRQHAAAAALLGYNPALPPGLQARFPLGTASFPGLHTPHSLLLQGLSGHPQLPFGSSGPSALATNLSLAGSPNLTGNPLMSPNPLIIGNSSLQGAAGLPANHLNNHTLPSPPPLRPIQPNKTPTPPVNVVREAPSRSPASRSPARSPASRSPARSPASRSPGRKEDLRVSDTAVDIASVRGAFGWASVDDVSLPYLLRDDKRYVAVRMVELKLLSRYPSVYPEELRQRPPLISHYVTNSEAVLLNEINMEHCALEYGSHPFKVDDLIVRLEDFEEFYKVVKKHFPSSQKSTATTASSSTTSTSAAGSSTLPAHMQDIKSQSGMARVHSQLKVSTSSSSKIKIKPMGGWALVNSTVTPYLLKNYNFFVPLSVMRYAAGLLNDVLIEDHVKPTEEECDFLNHSCQSAGIAFTFAASTRLVSLMEVQRRSDTTVTIQELPASDPFATAERIIASLASLSPLPSPSTTTTATTTTTSSSQSPPATTAGFPSFPAQPPSMRPGAPIWMNPHLGIYPGVGGSLPPGMSLPPAVAQLQSRQSAKSPPSPGYWPPTHGAAKALTTPSKPAPARVTVTDINSNVSAATSVVASTHRSKTPTQPPRGLMEASLSLASLGQATSVITGMSSKHKATTAALTTAALTTALTTAASAGAGRAPNKELATWLPNLARIVGAQAAPASHSAGQPDRREDSRTPPGGMTGHQERRSHRSSSVTSKSSVTPPPKTVSSTSALKTMSSSSVMSQDSAPAGANASSFPLNGSVASSCKPSFVPVVIDNKVLSCIERGPDREQFALVEALSRLYFPSCTVQRFRQVWEQDLGLPVSALSLEEEKAFILFYDLPTNRLLCNKVVKVHHFQEAFTGLKDIVSKKQSELKSAGTRKRHGPPVDAVSVKKPNLKPTSLEQSVICAPKKTDPSMDDILDTQTACSSETVSSIKLVAVSGVRGGTQVDDIMVVDAITDEEVFSLPRNDTENNHLHATSGGDSSENIEMSQESDIIITNAYSLENFDKDTYVSDETSMSTECKKGPSPMDTDQTDVTCTTSTIIITNASHPMQTNVITVTPSSCGQPYSKQSCVTTADNSPRTESSPLSVSASLLTMKPQATEHISEDTDVKTSKSFIEHIPVMADITSDSDSKTHDSFISPRDKCSNAEDKHAKPLDTQALLSEKPPIAPDDLVVRPEIPVSGVGGNSMQINPEIIAFNALTEKPTILTETSNISGGTPNDSSPLVAPGSTPNDSCPLESPGATPNDSCPLESAGGTPSDSCPVVAPGGTPSDSCPLESPGCTPSDGSPLEPPGGTPSDSSPLESPGVAPSDSCTQVSPAICSGASSSSPADKPTGGSPPIINETSISSELQNLCQNNAETSAAQPLASLSGNQGSQILPCVPREPIMSSLPGPGEQNPKTVTNKDQKVILPSADGKSSPVTIDICALKNRARELFKNLKLPKYITGSSPSSPTAASDTTLSPAASSRPRSRSVETPPSNNGMSKKAVLDSISNGPFGNPSTGLMGAKPFTEPQVIDSKDNLDAVSSETTAPENMEQSEQLSEHSIITEPIKGASESSRVSGDNCVPVGAFSCMDTSHDNIPSEDCSSEITSKSEGAMEVSDDSPESILVSDTAVKEMMTNSIEMAVVTSVTSAPASYPNEKEGLPAAVPGLAVSPLETPHSPGDNLCGTVSHIDEAESTYTSSGAGTMVDPDVKPTPDECGEANHVPIVEDPSIEPRVVSPVSVVESSETASSEKEPHVDDSIMDTSCVVTKCNDDAEQQLDGDLTFEKEDAPIEAYAEDSHSAKECDTLNLSEQAELDGLNPIEDMEITCNANLINAISDMKQSLDSACPNKFSRENDSASNSNDFSKADPVIEENKKTDDIVTVKFQENPSPTLKELDSNIFGELLKDCNFVNSENVITECNNAQELRVDTSTNPSSNPASPVITMDVPEGFKSKHSLTAEQLCSDTELPENHIADEPLICVDILPSPILTDDQQNKPPRFHDPMDVGDANPQPSPALEADLGVSLTKPAAPAVVDPELTSLSVQFSSNPSHDSSIFNCDSALNDSSVKDTVLTDEDRPITPGSATHLVMETTCSNSLLPRVLDVPASGECSLSGLNKGDAIVEEEEFVQPPSPDVQPTTEESIEMSPADVLQAHSDTSETDISKGESQGVVATAVNANDSKSGGDSATGEKDNSTDNDILETTTADPLAVSVPSDPVTPVIQAVTEALEPLTKCSSLSGASEHESCVLDQASTRQIETIDAGEPQIISSPHEVTKDNVQSCTENASVMVPDLDNGDSPV